MRDSAEEGGRKLAVPLVVGFAAFVSWFVAAFFRGSAVVAREDVLSPVCIAFLGSMCVALFAMVMLHEKLRVSFMSKRLLAVLGLALAAGGIGYWCATEVASGLFFLLVIAASLCGLSMGCFLLCWGLVSAAAYSDSMPSYCLSAAVFAFAFAAVCSLVPSIISAVLLYGACPAACLWGIRRCYAMYGDDIAQRQARLAAAHVDVSDTRNRIPWIMPVSMAMMWMAFGVVANQWIIDLESIDRVAVAAVDIVVCMLVLILVVLVKTVLRNALSMASLFWIVVPLLAAGFVAMNTGGDVVRFIAYVALYLSMAVSHMQLWQHFAWLASREDGIVSAQLFGWGWLFPLFGGLVGMLVSLILSSISLTYVAYLVPVAASVLTIALIFIRQRVEKVGRDALKSEAEEQWRSQHDARPSGAGAAADSQGASGAGEAACADGVGALSEPGDAGAGAGGAMGATAAGAGGMRAAKGASSAAGAAPERSFAELMQEIADEYRFTPRELQVASLLAQGRSQPYISEALFISKSTVNTHVGHIYEKMGIHSKQELIEIVQSS